MSAMIFRLLTLAALVSVALGAAPAVNAGELITYTCSLGTGPYYWQAPTAFNWELLKVESDKPVSAFYGDWESAHFSGCCSGAFVPLLPDAPTEPPVAAAGTDQTGAVTIRMAVQSHCTNGILTAMERTIGRQPRPVPRRSSIPQWACSTLNCALPMMRTRRTPISAVSTLAFPRRSP